MAELQQEANAFCMVCMNDQRLRGKQRAMYFDLLEKRGEICVEEQLLDL
jgi:hypothetical protein